MSTTATSADIRVATPFAAYTHCFRLGLRETMSQKGALLGSVLVYVLLVGVWASLWRLVPADALASLSFDYASVVWYVALTELIVLSSGHCYRRIEDDIRAGAAEVFLARPVGYVALTLAQELGHVAARIVLIGLPGCVFAYALTGTVPFGAAQLVPLAALMLAGAAIHLIVQIAIGLATAWFGTSRPIYFIAQKALFVLGGLLVPLTAYPELLQNAAWLTPFPAALYAPASLALDSSAAHIGRMLGLQAAWLAVTAGGLAILTVAFERRLTVRGEGR